MSSVQRKLGSQNMLRHVIRNHRKLLSDSAAQSFETLIEKRVQRLKRLLQNYHKPVTLEFHLSYDGRLYHLAASLNLRSKHIYVRESAHKPAEMIPALFKRLRQNIIEVLRRERKDHVYKRKERHLTGVAEYVHELDSYFEQKQQELFTNLIKTNVQNIRNYIRRRVQFAEYTGAVEKGSVSVEDLIQELCERLYLRYAAHPLDPEQFMRWIYTEADAMLAERLQEEEFERQLILPLEEIIAQREIDTDSFSIDAEGELVPFDEFDDPSYTHNTYQTTDIFEDIAVAESIEDQLDERPKSESIHSLVSKELARLPEYKRSIFDLHVLEDLAIEDIAVIKNTSPKVVQQTIDEVRDKIQKAIRKLT